MIDAAFPSNGGSSEPRLPPRELLWRSAAGRFDEREAAPLTAPIELHLRAWADLGDAREQTQAPAKAPLEHGRNGSRSETNLRRARAGLRSRFARRRKRIL